MTQHTDNSGFRDFAKEKAKLTSDLSDSIAQQVKKNTGKIKTLQETNDELFKGLSGLCENNCYNWQQSIECGDNERFSSEELENLLDNMRMIKPMGFNDGGFIEKLENHLYPQRDNDLFNHFNITVK